MKIREKDWKIKMGDGHFIYGSLVLPSKPAKKLVIFSHGLLGHQDQHIFFNGARYFRNKGIATFRFDLYSDKPKARHFEETTIQSYGKDLNEVAKSLRQQFAQIFLVGHSFGGTALLFTDPQLVDGYVFWDASYIDQAFSKGWDNEVVYDKKLGVFIADWGARHLIGKKLTDYIKDFPDCGKLIKKITKPKLFISAGKRGNWEGCKKYLTRASLPKRLINIKGADHNFNRLVDEDKLLEETWKWIKGIK